MCLLSQDPTCAWNKMQNVSLTSYQIGRDSITLIQAYYFIHSLLFFVHFPCNYNVNCIIDTCFHWYKVKTLVL